MSQAQDVYARSIRLGRLVPREIVTIRYVDAPAEPVPVAIPEPVHVVHLPPEPTNVIDAPIPVARPHVIFHEYPKIEDIMGIVADFYGVSTTEIRSSRRTQDAVWPRQVTMYLAKELTLLSYPMIGRAIGGRDHTTALKSVQKITGKVAADERLRDEIELLKIKISEFMASRNAASFQCAT